VHLDAFDQPGNAVCLCLTMNHPINPHPKAHTAADSPGHGARIVAYAQHRISTLTVRDDALIVVKQGQKSLIAAGGTLKAHRREGVLIARGTQWDVVNDPSGQGCYEAVVLSFGDELVREWHARHAIHAGPTQAVAAAQVLPMDEEVTDAVQRAAAFLSAKAVSAVVRRHRMMEVLLLLAERGHHFTAQESLGWDERVRRLVAQRPHADWSVEALAEAFHVSASTLRRRLDGHAVTLAALVREVRLEVALHLLQTTRASIGEIAQRCGWESHSRFSTAFQERWGFAPSVLRSGAVAGRRACAGRQLAQGAQDLTQQG
jgi:AraC-like DNA-binding protein